MTEIATLPIQTIENDSDPVAIMAAILRIPPAGSSEHTFAPVAPLLLTNAWQTVAGSWAEGAPPEGLTLDNASGVFTLSALGRWEPMLERIYHQHDTNPATPVMVYIKVQTSLDNVVWTDTDFQRSSIMSAATANDEPSVLPFTTALLLDVPTIPVYMRVQVKADEGGVTPEQAELALMKITSNLISKVPN